MEKYKNTASKNLPVSEFKEKEHTVTHDEIIEAYSRGDEVCTCNIPMQSLSILILEMIEILHFPVEMRRV